MSIPEFKPPTFVELRSWSGRPTSVEDDCLDAARWGFDQAVAQMPTWPEPITDRRPTEADADEWREVIVLMRSGWWVRSWDQVELGASWLHTPSWRPKQDPRQQALADLATLSGSPEAIERIRQVLEGDK